MIGGAANAALLNFTKSLADEGAPDGILITGVNPGGTAPTAGTPCSPSGARPRT